MPRLNQYGLCISALTTPFYTVHEYFVQCFMALSQASDIRLLEGQGWGNFLGEVTLTTVTSSLPVEVSWGSSRQLQEVYGKTIKFLVNATATLLSPGSDIAILTKTFVLFVLLVVEGGLPSCRRLGSATVTQQSQFCYAELMALSGPFQGQRMTLQTFIYLIFKLLQWMLHKYIDQSRTKLSLKQLREQHNYQTNHPWFASSAPIASENIDK